MTRLRRAIRGTRTRILATYLVLLAFSSVVSVLAIRQILVVRTAERVDSALTQEVEEFRRLAVNGIDPATSRRFGDDLRGLFDLYFRRTVPGEGEAILAFVDGRLYATVSSGRGGRPNFADVAERWGAVTSARRGTVDSAMGEVRYLAVPVRSERRSGVFVVTASLGAERAEVDEAVRVAAGVTLAVLLIASVLAWLIAGRVLAPLRVLTETARDLSETDLKRRIPTTGPDEVAELARTFNAMVARLDGAFGSQRAFIDDASHELRTPITIVRGHLELLEQDNPEERRETIALVTDELDRMSRFVDDLLLLAKAQRPDFLRLDDVDLWALGDELITKARGLGDREWRLEARTGGTIRADRQRLTQAMMGLAQNASQHTAPGDPILLGLAADSREASLWVRDSGPGVPEADRARIFERFARASASRRRSEGAGLGLSIVRAIAEAHGGRVELESRNGSGATFTVIIPVAP